MNTCEQTLKELLQKLKNIPRYSQDISGDFDQHKDGCWIEAQEIDFIIDQVNK